MGESFLSLVRLVEFRLGRAERSAAWSSRGSALAIMSQQPLVLLNPTKELQVDSAR